MRTILITGANKGIGLATVEAITVAHADVEVLLGSRDPARGEAARSTLTHRNRVRVLPIDVSDDESVHKAADGVDTLYGLVNNAGVGLGSGDTRFVLNVNTLGPKRVVDAFLPKLQANGRIVNVSSASGPNYVAAADPELRKRLIDPEVTWRQIEALINSRMGSETNAYGLSKALLNAYTQLLSREHPTLVINACTPGFIETDLTRPYATAQGVDPAAMGMKRPAQGTRATTHLLFADVGRGWFYGSDAERSPLDRYRAPGAPPYSGD